jgi:Zn-dependent M16 (insulinase) family peptidase
VLCGSQKFPVKEPFVDLLRGSLQNFLNAFTYPDRTCYPVASTNTKDFYNLVHVYLDAVLNPRAVHDPQVLQQEGWHYELTKPEDPLTIKGVVYNEMKGVYSSPDALLGRRVQQELFPHNTYAVDSGGNPADIPKLTFQQFQEFHRLYYHPSNSRIFFYGNDDPYQRLVLLDEYLSQFQSIPTKHSQIALQPKLNLDGKHVKEQFPIAAESEPKHMVTVNWLLNEKEWDSKELLALDILDYLLLGRSTSKLRKILTESQLGESVMGGGLSDDLIQSTYSTGLKGVKADNVEKVKSLIHNTLRSIANEGFSKEEINAAINSLEFKLREFNTGSYPKGLSVMLGKNLD